MIHEFAGRKIELNLREGEQVAGVIMFALISRYELDEDDEPVTVERFKYLTSRNIPTSAEVALQQIAAGEIPMEFLNLEEDEEAYIEDEDD